MDTKNDFCYSDTANLKIKKKSYFSPNAPKVGEPVHETWRNRGLIRMTYDVKSKISYIHIFLEEWN